MKQLFKCKKWVNLVLWAVIGCLIALGLPKPLIFRVGNPAFLSPVNAIAPQSTEISQTSSATVLLSEGVKHFQAERFEEAIAHWQQALIAYTQISDEQHRALVLSNLSLAYQHLGRWQEAEASLEESLAFFEQQPTESRSTVDWEYHAKALNAQGWLLWRRGQPETALDAWKQAEQAYASANYFPGIVGSRINQAKALQSQGLSIATREMLENVQQVIQQQGNPYLQVMALQSLGNALRRVGALEESQVALDKSLAIATQPLTEFSSPEQRNAIQSSILLDLGNTKLAQWERAVALSLDEVETYKNAALEYYQQSATIAPSVLPRTQALANTLGLLVNLQRYECTEAEICNSEASSQIWAQWETLADKFTELPLGRSSLAVQLNSVNSLLKLVAIPEASASTDAAGRERWAELAQVLSQTVQLAHQLQDIRTEALALGQLGHLYELAQQWTEAKQVTNQAIALSEEIQAPDIRYRWEWQMARILKQQAKPAAAINAFDQAVTSLEQVRQDLLFIDSDVQFSFRDDVEPLYRQFVDLLLRDSDVGDENLQKAVKLVDSLQLAELENYLGCNIDPIQLSERGIDPTAAILYPIILSDRLEVILQMPDQPLQRSVTPVDDGEFMDLTLRLYSNLPVPSRLRNTQQDAGQLYDLLIRPFENVLEAEQSLSNTRSIKTLVFVLDGPLRNLPMAALWDDDRQQYLLEQYAIAIAPSLQVIEPQPLRRPIKVLAAGSSEALDHPFRDDKFSPLQNVEKELDAIEALESLGRSQVSTDILFNETFTKSNLEQQLQRQDYSIVHLASHGVFSSDPERTFIALPDPDEIADPPKKENYAIFSEELDTLLRTRDQEGSTIELLVLSACQTATGDDRATLGLAGLTVRAGARSTLATLWSVDDESAATMMEYFYRQLAENPEISRSEALRQAQLHLWETEAGQMGNWKRPYFWAPYILAGNWL